MLQLKMRAHAKLNLGLWICGRLPDGYHRLRSVVQIIGLSDRLHFDFDRAPGSCWVKCHHPGVPSGEASGENLICRAVQAFGGSEPGVSVRLKKGIPVRAGLGGGSADAACAAAAVAAARSQTPPDGLKNWRERALSVGADVGLFLSGPTAEISGRGEKITRLPFPGKHWTVILHPPVAADTREVYRTWDEMNLAASRPGEAKELLEGLRNGDLMPAWRRAGNDLEPAAIRRYPVLAEWREMFREVSKRTVRMSGSGSSLYTLFTSRRAARTVHRRLQGVVRGRGEGDVYLSHFRKGPGWAMIGN